MQHKTCSTCSFCFAIFCRICYIIQFPLVQSSQFIQSVQATTFFFLLWVVMLAPFLSGSAKYFCSGLQEKPSKGFNKKQIMLSFRKALLKFILESISIKIHSFSQNLYPSLHKKYRQENPFCQKNFIDNPFCRELVFQRIRFLDKSYQIKRPLLLVTYIVSPSNNC